MHSNPMTAANQILVFDRALVRQHRNRAAASFADHAVLFEESAHRLAERLGDIKKSFKAILNFGMPGAYLEKYEGAFVVASDISERMLKQEQASSSIVSDEEFLPFASRSFDLIISNLSLHWVNDLPGALVQIKNCLQPDGLFLASVLGGQTLHELRQCLLEAELKLTGGISPRFSPTLDLQTASGLLQRAGFILPVADQETFTLTYPDIYALMRDLRGMGETNAHVGRLRAPIRRAVFDEAAKLYQQRFGTSEGRIPAHFEMLFLHGWKQGSEAGG